MFRDAIDCAEIGNFLLREVVTRSRVVIFISGITDIRGITTALGRRKIPHSVVLMRMEDERARDRFHLLTEATHWPYLPQIFIDGEFVGGDLEFYRHPLIARTPPAQPRKPKSRLRHPFRIATKRP